MPNAQQPSQSSTPFVGSQPGYNNPQFSPSGRKTTKIKWINFRVLLEMHAECYYSYRKVLVSKDLSAKLVFFFKLTMFVVGPQGPPSFNAAPTLTPGFNQQPQFGQPTASSLPGINAIPGGVQATGSGFGSPSPTGYPAASASTPSKGFANHFF